MDNLKPCPFCGGKAELDGVTDYPLAGYFVGCTTCGVITDTFYPPEKAIETWNRRVSDETD